MQAKPTRQQFAVRPLDYQGHWLDESERFYVGAIVQLEELKELARQVKERWVGQPVPNELRVMAFKRDLLSDNVKMLAAMAVEGFLNFYGVLRLGHAAYDTHFERLSTIQKPKALLLVCDSILLTDTDPLVAVAIRIAQRRNALAHPKVKEVNPGAVPNRNLGLIPESAEEAVADMKQFFAEFVQLVPGAAHLMPNANR